MGLFDVFRKKSNSDISVENIDVGNPTLDFVEEAEKAASIVSETIKDGKFDIVTKKLEQLSRKNKERERFVFDALPISRWVILLLIGLFFNIGFVYFLMIAGGTFLYSSSYRMYGIYGVAITVAVFILNILVIQKAIKEICFTRRYDNYQNVLRYKSMEIVDDLATMIEVDRKVVENDLNKAIKNKLIPQGHFGKKNVIFMVSDSVFNEYSKRRAVYDRYFNKLIEERNRMKKRTPETEDLLQQGQEYVEKIRDSNDIIKDKEISKKLDRMERVVATIFHEVDVNPAQANKLGVFMNYYLPTTEKLLESYIDLDEKTIGKASTEKTKLEISRALDSINEAFEGLLGRFYQEQERDVTSEIYAMEVIMKQEGLQSDE